MPTYFLYLNDRRYTVPTLEVITVSGDARVRGVAQDRLAASPHYIAVEIWEDERLVARIDRAGA